MREEQMTRVTRIVLTPTVGLYSNTRFSYDLAISNCRWFPISGFLGVVKPMECVEMWLSILVKLEPPFHCDWRVKRRCSLIQRREVLRISFSHTREFD
jgi:hypothetical protein